MPHAPRRRRVTSLSQSSVLLVEADDADARTLTEQLAEAGIRVTRATRLADAVAALEAARYDFVLADLWLPDASELEGVRALHPLVGDAPLIALAGADDEELALAAVHDGAHDYVVKDHADRASLRRTLRHARERKRMLDQLLHASRHDGLTGALNRGALRERLEAAIVRARRRDGRLAVLHMDLDNFKQINDAIGDAAADGVLRAAVDRLRCALKPGELIARLGGDEFAVLLDDVSPRDSLREIAHRILASFDLPFLVANRELRLTASIGAACYPDTELGAEGLLRAADAALYHAKRRGRSSVRIAGHSTALPVTEDTFADDLQHALERGELVLHFQPQFAIAREQLVGFEALLRWERPGHALVPPSEFIPLLEDSGRIVMVGEWVIERACEQLATWRAAGRTGVRIAVNLSARQFGGAGLVEWTRRCLRHYNIPPRCLELEITETNLMANTQQTTGILSELRALGVRLAIDDFGTGFSSLAYLNQFPVDCLKIDRSLVEKVGTHGDGETITHAIISLGHHLGLEVVAEGVETEAQLASLANAQCDLIQGYLLGRPGAAQAFDASDIWTLAAPEPATTMRLRPLRELA